MSKIQDIVLVAGIVYEFNLKLEESKLVNLLRFINCCIRSNNDR